MYIYTVCTMFRHVCTVLPYPVQVGRIPDAKWRIYHLSPLCRLPKRKYKSITPDDVAAKAASASQDMSHDSASQAMSEDVSGGDEDKANAADAAPALALATAPAPAVAADDTLAPSQAWRWKGS